MLKTNWRTVEHWPGPWAEAEPTLSELLSDSLIKAVMESDGVDPQKLEAELRSVARQRYPARGTRDSVSSQI